MCNLINVDNNGMAAISPEATVKGFKTCCISSAVDENDDTVWNGSDGDGDVRSECEEDEALTVKMETVTLVVNVDRA